MGSRQYKNTHLVRLPRLGARARCGCRRRTVGDQFRRRDRLVAQFVAGIGCVRNQFPQENIGSPNRPLAPSASRVRRPRPGTAGIRGGGRGLCHIGLRRVHISNWRPRLANVVSARWRSKGLLYVCSLCRGRFPVLDLTGLPPH
jgi:hypothetical protein